MRYLTKSERSSVLSAGLDYARRAERPAIRELLIEEQRGFCAYSERYFRPIDSAEIEHFDPRLKDTAEDGYYNWYAVQRWMNAHKPRDIASYEPLPRPYYPGLRSRIEYRGGRFAPADPADAEAERLIRYTGMNRPELIQERTRHVERIRLMRRFCESDEQFRSLLQDDPEQLSFITALEAELDMRLLDEGV